MIRGLQLRPKPDRGGVSVFYNTTAVGPPGFYLGYRGTLGYQAVFFAARTDGHYVVTESPSGANNRA